MRKRILHIATISANNDEEIGEVIKEAFVNIGDGGLVTVQPNFQRNGKTEVKYTNGIEYDKGYKTSALCNTNEETIVYDKTDEKRTYPIVILVNSYKF